MKLALDVWYEAWGRTEGGDARRNHGEVVAPPEDVRAGGLRDPGGVYGREPVGDAGASPYPGF